MKKLSKIQCQIIDCLNKNKDSYLLKSKFYNHNELLIDGQHIMQFTKPTFDFLLSNNYIKLADGNKYIKVD